MHIRPVRGLMFCLICAQTWLANQVRAKVDGKLSGKMLPYIVYIYAYSIGNVQLMECPCVCLCVCVINRFKCLWHLWLNSAQHTRLQFKTNQFSCTHNHTHTHTHTHTCIPWCNSFYCYSYCWLPTSSFTWTIYFFAGENLSSAATQHTLSAASLPLSRTLFAALLSDFICCHNSLNTVASVNQRTWRVGLAGGVAVNKSAKGK